MTRHGCLSVKSLLLDGFVPVLFGDCVRDTATGCCILSGDTIIKVTTLRFWCLHYKTLRERHDSAVVGTSVSHAVVRSSILRPGML